jgi:hypothetical protein
LTFPFIKNLYQINNVKAKKYKYAFSCVVNCTA